jgi:hypothetical protein
MKKIAGLLLSLSLLVLASAVSGLAQEKQPGSDDKVMFEKAVVLNAMAAGQQPTWTTGGNTFNYVNSEFSFDKLVKGAPYSAQAVTETIQLLGDGNRIVNTSSASVYRDGEGRTRREQSLKAIGPFGSAGEAATTVSIFDPVAGVSYVLEPLSRTARKMQSFRVETTTALRSSAKTNSNADGQAFTFARTPNGDVQFKVATEESKVKEEKERTNFRREDLGNQTVEGVGATGTRTTITIPVGQIGNERAIEIVDERWVSAELQTVVMTKHSDPRSGETTFRLTNINRTEPDHSLFEIPGDYQLRDDKQPMRIRVPEPKVP